MRDPKRLDKFYESMKLIHKEIFPDWRYGQLCSNFFSWLGSEKKKDPFSPEENEMLGFLKEYAKNNDRWQKFDKIKFPN